MAKDGRDSSRWLGMSSLPRRQGYSDVEKGRKMSRERAHGAACALFYKKKSNKSVKKEGAGGAEKGRKGRKWRKSVAGILSGGRKDGRDIKKWLKQVYRCTL